MSDIEPDTVTMEPLTAAVHDAVEDLVEAIRSYLEDSGHGHHFHLAWDVGNGYVWIDGWTEG